MIIIIFTKVMLYYSCLKFTGRFMQIELKKKSLILYVRQSGYLKYFEVI